MIIWLTGPSGAGKTTLAKALLEELPCVNLDGNEMRDSISLPPDGKPLGFSKKDRREHNLRVARLADVLSKQTTVVVSVIAPMKDVRAEIDRLFRPLWIYLKRKVPKRKGHFYEMSDFENIIDVDGMSVKDEVAVVRDMADLYPEEPASLFIGRYQPPHAGHKALIQTVLDEGKKVVVALRDTEYEESDPYTVGERKQMFTDMFPSEILSGRMAVIVIPDIEEVVWGRSVGWGRREIRLDKETEKISATAIRNGGEK